MSQMELQEFFKLHPRVAVAFSGGVDSAVLLLTASRTAEAVKAYFVKTAFQPAFELADAQAIAEQLNVELTVLTPDVFADSRIIANPPDRCYYCKNTVFRAIADAAARDGFTCILDGTNASDDIGDRPGYRALQERNVLSPLRLCGYTKSAIRAIAAENHLPVADKPSYACLATRIPAGTPITADLLAKTEAAEHELFLLGFRNFRIRWRDGAAVLEFGKAEWARFDDYKDEIVKRLTPYYPEIYLNLRERTDE